METTMHQLGHVEKLLYSREEVKIALGLSESTLWRLEKRGLLKALPGIRHKLYPVAAVRRFATLGAEAPVR